MKDKTYKANADGADCAYFANFRDRLVDAKSSNHASDADTVTHADRVSGAHGMGRERAVDEKYRAN